MWWCSIILEEDQQTQIKALRSNGAGDCHNGRHAEQQLASYTYNSEPTVLSAATLNLPRRSAGHESHGLLVDTTYTPRLASRRCTLPQQAYAMASGCGVRLREAAHVLHGIASAPREYSSRGPL